ncbi:MAG: AzlC family ABC transporter permease, partial [Oscillospiraceae bacterium]
MQEKLSFSSGVKDGIPIALGYLSVSFAFGMLAISKGLPIWSPILISATNLTGTGQFVGMGLISTGAAFVEIACTIFVINIRYMLMSLSMSQKIHEKVTLPQRFLIAFGITDEIFGVSMQKTLPLTFKYMSGLIICS